MEEVRRIANATYQKLPEKPKQKALELFKSMDKNGDGKIVTSEFFHFFETDFKNKLHGRSIPWLIKLFQDLDKDGNGDLDFTEFITLFYLLFFGVCCASCEAILNGTAYFNCVGCSQQKQSFDLCRSCYTRKNFTHTHEDGVVPVFQEPKKPVPVTAPFPSGMPKEDVASNGVQMVQTALMVGNVIITADKLHDFIVDHGSGDTMAHDNVYNVDEIIDNVAGDIVDMASNIVDVADGVVNSAADVAGNIADAVADSVADNVVDVVGAACEVVCNLM